MGLEKTSAEVLIVQYVYDYLFMFKVSLSVFYSAYLSHTNGNNFRRIMKKPPKYQLQVKTEKKSLESQPYVRLMQVTNANNNRKF